MPRASDTVNGAVRWKKEVIYLQKVPPTDYASFVHLLKGPAGYTIFKPDSNECNWKMSRTNQIRESHPSIVRRRKLQQMFNKMDERKTVPCYFETAGF